MSNASTQHYRFAIGTQAARRERLLLALAAAFLAVSWATFGLAQRRPAPDLWPFVVWIGCAVGGHLFLTRRLPGRDQYLYPVVMLLTGWGILITARTAPPFAVRQTAWLVVGVGALLIVANLPHHLRWLSRYRYMWLALGLGLLILTIFAGRNPSGGGPRLWLGVPDVYFQPSELLKLLLVAFLASYFADHEALLHLSGRRSGAAVARFLAPLILMWGMSVLVLLWQQDLGTAALFFIVFIAMIGLASGEITYVIGGAVLLLAAGGVAYFFIDVVRVRIDIWLNPWPEANNRAFQIVQSLMAFAAGGVLGRGAGMGSPVYVPVVHSDFAFAALAEEWGLIGSVVVVLLFALITMRGLRLAARLEGRLFRAYLSAGISLMLAVQSLLIMGGALKLIPLTGVTLPFLSYGGSSLLMSFVMVGLVLVISNDG